MLRISSYARQNLTQLARDNGYIRPPRNPALVYPYATMAPFIKTLSTLTFEDTRDPDLQALDAPRALKGLPPIWYDKGPGKRTSYPQPELRNRQWQVAIHPNTLQQFIALATLHNIQPLQTANPTPLQIVGAVLEAIGQYNLTPTQIPRAYHKWPTPYYRYSSQPHYYDPSPYRAV